MRNCMEQLGALSPPPVVLTWPITALSGWGTAGRAVVREMMRGDIATPILIAPLPPPSPAESPAAGGGAGGARSGGAAGAGAKKKGTASGAKGSADLSEEFTAMELAALRRTQRIMRRMLELQVVRRLVDGDAAVMQQQHPNDNDAATAAAAAAATPPPPHPLEIVAPMPVFHALGNGFVSSAAGTAPPVRWGRRSWNVALKGSPSCTLSL